MSISITILNQPVHVGDTVAVHQSIKEGGKSRVQVFEGIVIGIQNREENKTFTVRKIATGSIGVEKIFPVMLPSINKVVVKRSGVIRRSKLYHLRQRVGVAASKLKEKKTVVETTKA